MSEILTAVSALDPSNDDHWTSDGLPRVDVVSELLGGAKVTREQITNAAPQVTRDSLMGSDQAGSQASDDVPPGMGRTLFDEVAGNEPETTMDVPPIEDGEIDALSMPSQVVFSDPALLKRGIEQLSKMYESELKIRDAAKERMDVIAGKIETASIWLSRIQGKPRETDAVRRYQERQREARAERAARARRFIEAGTTAKDVAEQLRGTSKLDQAMGVRKASPDSRRPQMVPPSN